MYTLTDSALTIPDPEAFGFDGPDLESADFKVVADEYVRDRRSYNIRRVVIRHEASGRFFATEYSTHEDEGFEWGPGMGRNTETTWREVRPREVITTVYA
jgi:hypothetical protein